MEAEIIAVAGVDVPVMGDENEKGIKRKEVKRPLDNTRVGKAPGMDGVRADVKGRGRSTISSLVLIPSSTGCNALHITDLDVPKVIQNGSRSSVILDCIYSYEPHDQGSLVVKWFWNHEPEAVYQWIPGKKPEAIGILRGRLNLEYSASKDKYSQHRALEILYPTTELTGFYTCSVSSFHDEEFESKRMIVYAPATRVNVSYHKTTPSTVNVTCDAHGMYPKPLLRLYEGATKQSRSLVKEAHEEVIEAEDGFSVYLQAQMEDRVLKQQETIFECVLSILETEYQVRRNIIYFKRDEKNYNEFLLMMLMIIFTNAPDSHEGKE
ncbi:uncharacterized protein [Palaemon carinicauda]|uniref:uncharacterized protein n=1 Tax=Palaemon carinicauda TaxID=392227 RepID=UPI0035B5B8BD